MASPISKGVLIAAWMVICCIQVAFSGYERNCDLYRPPSPMGKCGKQLADLVDNVCKFYYGGKKRSTDGKVGDTWLGQKQDLGDSGVFLTKDKALSVLNKRGGYMGSITCECCQYQCTFHELSQYCSVTAIKRSLGTNLGSLLRQNIISGKEREDIKSKQLIGQLLRKYGPQWLEDYLQYLDV